jgi:hypothetical protein
MDDFKEIMPLIEELANPALKARHWQEIFTLINADIPLSENGTGEVVLQLSQQLQVWQRKVKVFAFVGLLSNCWACPVSIAQQTFPWQHISLLNTLDMILSQVCEGLFGHNCLAHLLKTHISCRFCAFQRAPTAAI